MKFLDHVMAEKQREVAAAKAALPAPALLAAAHREKPRDFLAAVLKPRAVIAELKAFTPTIAAFRNSEALFKLARTYEENGAAAISIVTDPARFGTSLNDVAAVRETVSLPVLAKDFVIDAYQIIAARAAGADAVLLIVRLLDLERLRALLRVAHDLGMAALVETHSEPEILAALTAGAGIIGINNRDLDTLQVSLDITRRLASLVPDDVVLVSESGIASREDIEDLAAHGAKAFLVGGSLLSAGDPGAMLRALTGYTVNTVAQLRSTP